MPPQGAKPKITRTESKGQQGDVLSHLSSGAIIHEKDAELPGCSVLLIFVSALYCKKFCYIQTCLNPEWLQVTALELHFSVVKYFFHCKVLPFL